MKSYEFLKDFLETKTLKCGFSCIHKTFILLLSMLHDSFTEVLANQCTVSFALHKSLCDDVGTL